MKGSLKSLLTHSFVCLFKQQTYKTLNGNTQSRRRPPPNPRPEGEGAAHGGERTPNGSKRPIKVPQQSEMGPWWPSKITRSLRSRSDSNFPLSQ